MNNKLKPATAKLEFDKTNSLNSSDLAIVPDWTLITNIAIIFTSIILHKNKNEKVHKYDY